MPDRGAFDGHGQFATRWSAKAVMVYGGFQLRLRRWVRTCEGWDDEDGGLLSFRLFQTEAEAMAFADIEGVA